MLRFIRKLRDYFVSPLFSLFEKQLVMQAVTQSCLNNNRKDLSDLSDVEFSAFSQWGEDGIISWLTSQLTSIPKTFVEFGVENYRESNTRLLLQLRNWRGLVLDGSNAHVKDIMNQGIYWRYGLTAKCAFIDRVNINDLLRSRGMVGEIGSPPNLVD